MKRFLFLILAALLFIGPVVTPAQAIFVNSDIQSPTVTRRVSILADLKLITGNSRIQAVELMGRITEGDGGEGVFRWLAGDQSADAGVLADTLEGKYVKPTTPGDGSTGVWVRADAGRLNFSWFGAKPDDAVDDSAAFNAALALGTNLILDPGVYDLANEVTSDSARINITAYGAEVRTTVPTSQVFRFGTTAAVKYDLRISGLRMTFISGGTSAIQTFENLEAVFQDILFVDYPDYNINAKAADGVKIINCRSVGGSYRLASEVDTALISGCDFSGAVNHPVIEIYGGLAIAIEKSFINWSQHEGIFVGFDSLRGDYPQSLAIDNCYFERLAQTDTSSSDRPFIYIGAPFDDTGAAYAGAEVVRFSSIKNSYFNADVTNTNLANVAPALFERTLESRWENNRVVNFVDLNPRVKFPAQRARFLALEEATDISITGNASIQVLRPMYSRFRTVDIVTQKVSVPLDGSGIGSFTFANVNTGLDNVTVGDVFVNATPDDDSRAYVDTISVSASTGPDGKDQVTFVLRIAGGPISTSITVSVTAKILI